MSKAETLQRIKEAEAQTRTAKEAAERERETILRNARREALELQDTFRAQAEIRYAEILAAAEAGVAAERDRMLAAAREEAARIAARGRANVDKAVELVLSKFRGALSA
jgi:V/A-type H+-transporting ATPase subunit G/H